MLLSFLLSRLSENSELTISLFISGVWINKAINADVRNIFGFVAIIIYLILP